MVKPTKEEVMGLFKISSKLVLKPLSPGVPNINWKQLTRFCRMKINSFGQFGKRIDTPDGPYFYKDNGADILAVAHLDYVLGPLHTQTLKLSDDHLYFCPTLDDRAGVYAILDYLPSKGLKYDVLLTTGEEKSMSTARYFKPPSGKRYRYMFSFDRRGTDVVMYQYYDKASVELLKQSGWEAAHGSYSDIGDLEHLRCKGFNFGVGYHSAHTSRCYLSRSEFLMNMRKFIRFYNSHLGDWFPHTPQFNSYSLEDGFQYLYSNLGQNQDTFTDEDIEIIEILERMNYDFGNKRITPLDIKEIILDYQGVLSKRDYAEQVTKTNNDQLRLQFKASKEKIKSNKHLNISKIPLTVGSEDNPDYNGKSRKTDIVAPETKPVTVFIVGPSGETELKVVSEIAEENNLVPLGVADCTRCHSPFSFYYGMKSTLCPKCLEENQSIKAISKRRIGAKLVLNKAGARDVPYKYVEDKEGGKGWYWTGEYPVRVRELAESDHATLAA